MQLDLILFGERIRRARERAGLSQEELATTLGRDQRTISQYENGRRKIMITELPILARTLKVPVMYFFEGEAVLDNLDKQVLEEFHQLNEDADKVTVIEFIRLFSEAIARKSNNR
jgi:transcriptional regulator with XRE-family HTH domain